MSIASETNRNSYVGNGAVDTYSYTFKIYDDSDLLVTVKSDLNVETTLTLNTHYSVTGVGESNGGSVALVNGAFDWIDTEGDLKSGYTISIRRNLQLIQETDIRNQGEFFPEVHEDAFDRLTMYDQQQQDEIDRSVKLSETADVGDFDPTLPVDLIGQVSKTIVTNATGDGFAVGPSADAINQAAADAASAAASADLAEDWAIKTDDLVSATDNSSKAWAIGGTGGGQPTAGPAKDWATKTSSNVDGSEYSAKEYASGSQTRGVANGGSSKDWANYTGGTVDDTEYSAKKYANDAAASAAAAATASASSLWNDVVFKTFGDSPISIVDSDAGTMFAIDCSGGNVVVNLPDITTLTLTGTWSVGFKKTDTSSNTITINRSGSDLIDGSTSKIISRAEAGITLIPDVDSSPDEWTTISYGEVPISGDIVGTTDTQDMSNKTFTDAIQLTEISTPSTPASGKFKVYPKNDGRLYGLNDDGIESAIGSGSGAGSENIFSDNVYSGLSVSTFSQKQYSAASKPSGSPSNTANANLTLTASSGEILLEKLGSVNLQGYSFSADLTVLNEQKGHVVRLSTDYRISSGTYTSDDVTVYAYDVTNGAYIEPVPFKIQNHTLPSEKWAPYPEFQIPYNCSTIRFIFYVASTTTNNFVLAFKNMVLGRQAQNYGSPVLDWQNLTGVTGSWTSNTTYSAKYKKNGDSADYDIDVNLSGAPDATSLTVTLPHTIDIAKRNASAPGAGDVIGYATILDAGTAERALGPVIYNSSTSVSVRYNNSDIASPVTNTAPITFANGDRVYIRLRDVPIVGWSSSQIMSSDANTIVVSSRVYKSGTQAAASGNTKLTSFAIDKDRVGMWNSGSNRFEIKTPGDYDLFIQINASISSVRFMPAYSINGSSLVYIGTFTDGGSDRSGGQALITDLKAGDYVELYISTNGSATVQAGNTNTFASLVMRQGPSQIAASETIEASYYTSAGPTVDNTAPVVIFGSKEFDDYGIYNTSTGTMTAPISGKWTFTVASVAATQTTAGFSVVPILDPSSGNSKQLGSGKAVTNGGEASAGGSVTVKLLAGETAQIKVYADSSSSLSTANPGERNLLFIRRTGNY